MVKREEIHEEHREYLDIKDNPVRTTTTAVFKLVSDGLIDLRERISIVETKQDLSRESLEKIEVKFDKSIDVTDAKIESIEDDFKDCQVGGMRTKGRNEERFTWIARAIKLVIALSCGSLAFLMWHLGIPFFFP